MNSEITKITLDKLEVGEICCIDSIELNGIMRRRLQDLGLIPGTLVECTGKSPGKGPIAYRVRETVYALRRDDACNISAYVMN